VHKEAPRVVSPSSAVSATHTAPAPPAATSSYIVACKGAEAQEVVIRTLIGEYAEQGNNHGRAVYKKVIDNNPDAVDVFLYYWDGRDGPAFQGWWFGNKLGGTQVWSHNTSEMTSPPVSGWKIPWDGQVRPSVTVTSKAEQIKAVVSNASEGANAAKEAIDQAKRVADDYSDPEALKQAEQLLVPHVQTLSEGLKSIMDNQRGGFGPEAVRSLAHASTYCRQLQQSLNAELVKLRSAKTKAEQALKEKESMARDMGAFQEFLPEAEAKANLAEDSVEKAVITSEMIQAAGDDMDEVKQAMTQTEQVVQEAQKAIGEARIFLNAKQASTRRYESETARQQASSTLGKLQAQLQEAQVKLNPLKTVRQDYLQRVAAQKLVSEVMERLTPAEVDVDRAEEASMMLTAELLSPELLKQAEEAVTKAGDNLNMTLRFIEQKKKAAIGVAKEELDKMEERTRVSQQRLAELKSTQREAQERVACQEMVREAAEKLQSITEAVAKATDAEGPFLMGVEELPLDETKEAIQACEDGVTAANTQMSIARMFIATKLVEAKRFSKGPSQDALEKLKEFQLQLDSRVARLNELKAATQTRKAKSLMQEAAVEVTRAEGLAKQVAEAGAPFENDEQLFALSASEIREAADAVLKAESAATAVLIEARKFITQRQIEAKGKDATSRISSELIKYQTRLSSAQTDVSKYRKLAGGVDARLATKRIVDEAVDKFKTTEEKVDAFAEAVTALGKESGATEEELKGAEKLHVEAVAALKGLARYIEAQTRSTGPAKDEVTKLRSRYDKTQKTLDSAVGSMKERAEEIQVGAVRDEAEQRMKVAEEAMGQVVAAEAVILKGANVPIEDASKALADLEVSIASANTAVGSAKTFIAMKRLAAKRLGEVSKHSTGEVLEKCQERLDRVAKKLLETKKGMADRKASTMRREATSIVADVEKKVEAAEAATKEVASGAKLGADEMKSACEKVGKAQGDAKAAIEAALSLLLSRQRDARGSATDAGAATLAAELNKHVEQVKKIQVELDKQKSMLREQEHKFVAQHLLKDASEIVEQLEKKLEETSATASLLINDKSDDFAAVVTMTSIMEMLKQCRLTSKMTAKDQFQEITAKKGLLTEDMFVAYVTKQLETDELKEHFFSKEQQRAAFKKMLGDSDVDISEAGFLEQCIGKYMVAAPVSMTDTLTVKGGKTVRKLDLEEILDVVEEPIKEQATGLFRVKAKAERDGKEGYVTLSGNQGTVYLEPYSAFIVCQKKAERALMETADCMREALRYIDLKAEELRGARQGPLAETKSELMKMRPRVRKVEVAMNDMKRKVSSAQKNVREALANEKKKRQEATERQAAATLLEEAQRSYSTLQAEVDKAVATAEAVSRPSGADEDDPLTALAAAEKELEAAVVSAEKLATVVKEKLDTIKGAVKGPLGEARASLVKLKVSVGGLDSRCKKQIASLRTARKQVSNGAHAAIVAALKRTGIGPEELFKQLSKGGDDISVEALRFFLSKLGDTKLKASQLDPGLERYATGFTRLSLLEMLQEYQKCVKEIAITTAFEVKDSKTIRKISVGETLEVLEPLKVDQSVGLSRVRCRAVSDSTEGWVTLKGNQGTPFLEKGAKPFYCCDQEAVLSEAFDGGSAEVRKMKVGEVFEVIEGPRKEESHDIQRVRGKAQKDGKTGWFTLRDATGFETLELTKLLVCKQSIAVTTSLDISEGKAIRKLDVGESLEPLEEEQVDEKKNLTRIRVRATRDAQEGWVTIKGNQGTAYAEANDKLFVCKRAGPLESRVIPGSSVVRTLEVGEVFEVTDGPKTEVKEGAKRVKGRNLSDGAVGWFTLAPKAMSPWSPQYKCVEGTVLHDTLDIATAGVVRKLEPGEILQALATPALEKATGLLRVRVRAEKDGKVGFATARSDKGNVILEPASVAAAPKPVAPTLSWR